MALLDQYGRPVRVQKLAELQAEPGVTSLRQIWSASVASGLSPTRLAGILRGCDQGQLDDFLVLAEEMEERDAHYFSVLGTRKRIISGAKPRVEPASDDKADREIAEAVEAEIAQHEGLPALIEDMLDALGKGFSVIEIDWATGARRWTPRQFLHRDPRFFTFDQATGREVRLRDALAPQNGLPLEPFHFITHMARMKSGLPYRGGLARMVAFGWMCKGYAMKDWMAFVETYGLPLRIGRYGPSATPEDVAILFRAVANIGTDAAAVLPESMRIDFEQAASGATGDRIFENLARYVDEQISKAVLGQTMTADNGSSQAQANVHDEVRHDLAASDARAVTATLNRDLVRPFVDLNWGPRPAYPRLVIEIPEPEDVKALIEATERMLGKGLRVRASEIRAKLGWSEPDEGDEVIGGAPAAAAPPPANLPVAPGEVARNSALPVEAPDEIDQLVEGLAGDGWRPVMDDLVAPIIELVERAESFADLTDALPAVIGDMKDARLIDALVRGMARARGLGDARDG